MRTLLRRSVRTRQSSPPTPVLTTHLGTHSNCHTRDLLRNPPALSPHITVMGPRMWGRGEARGPLLRAKEEQKQPFGPTPLPRTQGCVPAEHYRWQGFHTRRPRPHPCHTALLRKAGTTGRGKCGLCPWTQPSGSFRTWPWCLGLWVPVVPIPAELREGTAGQVPGLGQGGQSGSVLGCRGQKRSAGGGAGQGGHRREGRRRVCCLWSWNG